MKQVKKWHKTNFGLCPNYGKEIPKDADIVILCELHPRSGLQVHQLLLPHQVYMQDLDPSKKWVVIPARSEDYIELIPHKNHRLKKDEYEEDRESFMALAARRL